MSSSGASLALAFGAVLAGALLLSSGVRNRSLSEILKGATEPNETVSEAPTLAEPSSALANATGSASAGQIVSYFEKELGLSKAQAAGIEGNLQQESGLNPGEAGGGLDQGQGARNDTGTLSQSLAKIKAELLGPERGSLERLRKAQTPEQAARSFSENFERPGIPDLANRERYAAAAAK